MHAIVQISFVQDAIQKTVSIVIGSSWFRPRLPDGHAQICLPFLSTATKTMPATPVDGSPVTLSSDCWTAFCAFAFMMMFLNEGRKTSAVWTIPSYNFTDLKVESWPILDIRLGWGGRSQGTPTRLRATLALSICIHAEKHTSRLGQRA